MVLQIIDIWRPNTSLPLLFTIPKPRSTNTPRRRILTTIYTRRIGIRDPSLTPKPDYQPSGYDISDVLLDIFGAEAEYYDDPVVF